MRHSHIAVGLDSIGAVRVEILWTPGKEGIELSIKDPKSLVEYGAWKAPRLQIMPGTPDGWTLNSAVRMITAAVIDPCLWVLVAHGMAYRGRLNWVPEKLAGVAA